VDIRISAESADGYVGDAVVVGVFEAAALSGPAAEVNAGLDGMIQRLIDTGEIRGKSAEVTILHTYGRLPAARVAAVGLGTATQADLFALRRASGAAARVLRDRGCRRVGTALHQALTGPRSEQLVRAVVEAAYVGLYRGEERKTQRALPDELDEIAVLGVADEHREAASAAARVAQVGGMATNYARRLVNLPANDITPSALAEQAGDIAKRTGMEVDILEPARLREIGMGALLAVASGSDQPARLIVLRHRGKGSGPQVAFVGKGLTFDSGGISIKPAEKMHIMKSDMAGAAAVLGAMHAVAEMKVPLDVMGIIPASENLPSGHAYRPGDVLTAFGGKTIEVISTDAEGRLILADALGYAKQLGATHLIDIATLTGACIIALGYTTAGVMGNDNELVEAVLDAGERVGERMWRLPLFPEYRAMLDSAVADLKNVGGRPAGAILGGWFLQEFVGETSWAHIDIAGTSWSEQNEPYQIEGATGAGVRTLLALAERMAGGVM